MEELKKLEFQKDNFYIYEPAEKLCDNSFCFTMQDDQILYWDKDHISNLGNEYIYGDFIEFLKSEKLL